MNRTVLSRWKAALNFIKSNKPWSLVGLNYITGLLAVVPLMRVKSWLALPLLFGMIPVCLILSAGLSGAFLKVVRGSRVGIMDVLEPFKDFETFKRLCGGMCWEYLWLTIWIYGPAFAFEIVVLLPMAVLAVLTRGIYYYSIEMLFEIITVIAFAVVSLTVGIYKSIQYAFTPYILMTRPEVRPTEALRLSKQMTKGRKGTIFLATVLPGIIVGVYSQAIVGLSIIPFIGWIFGLVGGVISIIIAIVYPVAVQIVSADIYDEALRNPIPFKYSEQIYYQPNYPSQPQSAEPVFTPAPTPETVLTPTSEPVSSPEPESAPDADSAEKEDETNE